MDLNAFKKEYVLTELGVDSSFGRMLAIIDFGNVNHWFSNDRQDSDNAMLAGNEYIEINLKGLKSFSDLFTDHTRFYYGHDAQKDSSLGFLMATKHTFGKSRVFTKPIQKVRHHLKPDEILTNTRKTFEDSEGLYVQLPKCNFDVEMTVDAIMLMQDYDTLILFSGDADFVSLNRYLRKNGKKVILIKGGNITQSLRSETDKVINAQRIKRHIAVIKKTENLTTIKI
jgi:uncharacterized LabA/DUF88 family protein